MTFRLQPSGAHTALGGEAGEESFAKRTLRGDRHVKATQPKTERPRNGLDRESKKKKLTVLLQLHFYALLHILRSVFLYSRANWSKKDHENSER